MLGERVHKGAADVGHHHHVALVNLLKTADAGPVESKPVDQRTLIHLVGGERVVLQGADQVGKLEVDDLYIVCSAEGDDFFGCFQFTYFLFAIARLGHSSFSSE